MGPSRPHRVRNVLSLVALVLAGGCPRQSPSSDVSVEYPADYTGPQPSTWLPPGMHCQNLIPAALRAEMSPGAPMIERPEMPSHVTCRLSDRPLHREVSFICRDEVMLPENLARAKDIYRGAARGREVAGIGRLALVWETSEVKFWDDDTNCVVDVLWLDGGERIIPFARLLAAHLSPETLSR